MRPRTECRFEPLTSRRWNDLEELFGANGACGGCWCMFFRLSGREFERDKGERNRAALRALVETGEEAPGILAYDGSRPVGWCSVAPRERFGRVGRSRILQPVDERPVWSVVCFYVAKGSRRSGLSVALLEAACDHVREAGGRWIEGYPVEPKKGEMPAVFAYTGLASAFRRAGFEEVARRSPTRPIMRRAL